MPAVCLKMGPQHVMLRATVAGCVQNCYLRGLKYGNCTAPRPACLWRIASVTNTPSPRLKVMGRYSGSGSDVVHIDEETRIGAQPKVGWTQVSHYSNTDFELLFTWMMVATAKRWPSLPTNACILLTPVTVGGCECNSRSLCKVGVPNPFCAMDPFESLVKPTNPFSEKCI
jgi:hypothetical protein